MGGGGQKIETNTDFVKGRPLNQSKVIVLLQVTKESLKRLFGQHEVSSNGKLSIASHDVMQAKVWVS